MIVPIVEGEGDAEAAPHLFRRILHDRQVFDVGVGRAKIAHGVTNLTPRGGEEEYLERFLRYASREPRASGIQLPLTSLLSIPTALERSRSFRRLVHALDELVTAIRQARPIVSPPPSPPGTGAVRHRRRSGSA